MTDDSKIMDELQRAANMSIDSLLPFEPGEEVRQETRHEQPEEVEYDEDEGVVGEVERIESEYGDVEADLGLDDL